MSAVQEMVERSLDEMSKELAALADSRVIKTEEGRALVAQIQRLVETLRHGEPKTPIASRHHA